MNPKNIKLNAGANTLLGLLLVLLIVLAALTHILGAPVAVTTFTTLAFIIAALALAAAYFKWVAFSSGILFAVIAALLWVGVSLVNNPQPKSAQFQAVFLTNGQVYFGHLKNAESGNPTLTDVYYLQSNSQNPQQANQTTNSGQLSLVKLGNELHGPESEMVVKSQQILFWENLKDSGKVVQAIKQNTAK